MLKMVEEKERRKRRSQIIMMKMWKKSKSISQMDITLYLPSDVMLQNANIGIPSFIEDSQYLPLVASSSLILISLQDSAASSGMEPSGTN